MLRMRGVVRGRLFYAGGFWGTVVVYWLGSSPAAFDDWFVVPALAETASEVGDGGHSQDGDDQHERLVP
jgi:hypothetical protein